MASEVTALPGHETLVSCWEALAQRSAGARLVRVATAIAAVFPAWEPLNNAIARDPREGAAAASELTSLYAAAGIGAWALWLPSHSPSLEAADDGPTVPGFVRETTTLAMHTTLTSGFRLRAEVVPASIAAVARFDAEPIPVSELGNPETGPGLAAWAMTQQGVAVSCGWTFLHGTDCGIYAVETLPSMRRQGLARSLVEHMLADAAQRGARTASLQSTQMGQPLYESLGFKPAGRYEEWTPKESPARSRA